MGVASRQAIVPSSQTEQNKSDLATFQDHCAVYATLMGFFKPYGH